MGGWRVDSDSDSEGSVSSVEEPCTSWTMDDDELPRSEMSWVCEAGGFKRVGRVILTLLELGDVLDSVHGVCSEE